ncbi:sugar ABC transporter ATP-binding protein [Agromyces aerolatus]|uniref:sugar ABC transporter ATP-binding protein n=1 Tax=Agromyces sp. LY-1074 TaxID=3074080 RepID=UPI00285E6188|nr:MULTISPECIES: sugar ABC transporter ATP-binding protein [unclassified Agromyces]MDR5701133.1 sugar ABC transporter ATP-binding protein [Agromyces sp. LY-1074]MDR5707773.1 sugar ABC transporter ATP-binding protein [Agromyces sp. LY-1358]
MTMGTSVRAPVGAPVIGLEGIGKSYHGVTVLHDVTLEIAPGEIHGLLGENGAGKSTLLKILGGSITADAGTLLFDGTPARLGSPRESIAHGVSLIAQELALVPNRTVLENVFLGHWANTSGIVRPGADRARFDELCEQSGFDLDPDRLVASLPLGTAQQVEILKALARGSRVLCLDEPTAALGETETAQLLTVLRTLARQGTTIVIVSHFLEEILGLADRITVLRDGAQIVTEDAAGHTTESLVRLMVGREVAALSRTPDPVPDDAPVVLRTERLTTDRIADVSLEVRAGEVLGLAGLVGSGRSETLRALFGADRRRSGTIEIGGRVIRRGSIRRMIDRGLALVPESRKDEGLVLARDTTENVALASLGRRQVGGVVRRGAERAAVDRVITTVDVRGSVGHVPVGALSGGNQQKALFAKWLVEPPIVLLIDEPTRGVDIAAKVNIHTLILDLAAAGTAVIVVSSELEEVMALSHRILVLRRGRTVAEFTAPADREDIMSAAFL